MRRAGLNGRDCQTVKKVMHLQRKRMADLKQPCHVDITVCVYVLPFISIDLCIVSVETILISGVCL